MHASDGLVELLTVVGIEVAILWIKYRVIFLQLLIEIEATNEKDNSTVENTVVEIFDGKHRNLL